MRITQRLYPMKSLDGRIQIASERDRYKEIFLWKFIFPFAQSCINRIKLAENYGVGKRPS